MIGKEKQSHAEDLISYGVPQSLVARVLGIGRRTVVEIAGGVKRRREPRKRSRPADDKPRMGNCTCGAFNVEIMPSGLCRVCEIRLTITPKRQGE